MLEHPADVKHGHERRNLAVDVAVVTWNTAPVAISAASSFISSRGVETHVTVVDNASSAGDRELLESDLPPDADLVLNAQNVGYGSAANQALAGGRSRLVCVSNADVVLDPTQLGKLARVAEETPRSGMVGPKFSGKTNAYHAHLPTVPRLAAGAFIGRLGRRLPALPEHGAVAAIGQVSGACFVMRRSVWEEMGGFDERFFLWYDDVDLARRLTNAGYLNLVVGSAVVSHGGAASFDQLPGPKAQEIRLTSLSRYLEKHHARQRWFWRPLLALARRLRIR